MDVLYDRSDFITIYELRYRWKDINVNEILYLLDNKKLNIYSLECNYQNNKIRIRNAGFITHSLSFSNKMDRFVISGLDYDDIRKRTVIISLEGFIDTTPPIDDWFDALVMISEIEAIENLWQGQDKQTQDLEQAQARVAELEQQLAEAQGEIASLKEERAGHTAQDQSMASSQAELERAAHARTREELDATKAKLKDALKAPSPQARGTYWLLLHVLFLKCGIDCRAIETGSRNSYATDLETAVHETGYTLDEKTIRAKMKEVQSYLDMLKNG